jgi:hypothetical protein
MKLSSPSEFYMAAKYRGYWVPRSRHGLSARRTHGPSGISSSAPAQRRDSLSNPLLGFDSPTRPVPTSPPTASRPRAPLLGFCRPYNARGEESPRLVPVAQTSSPVVPGIRRQFPGCRLRCRSQAFPASQRPSSSLRPPAIFRRVAFLGFGSTGCCSFRETPGARRHRCALLPFFPRIALSPFLGGDNRGRMS